MTFISPTILRTRNKNLPTAPRLGGPFTCWKESKKLLVKNLGTHKFGSLQLILPEFLRKQITDWVIKNIFETHLGPGGIEFYPHITLKYGLKDSSEGTIESLHNLLAKQ